MTRSTPWVLLLALVSGMPRAATAGPSTSSAIDANTIVQAADKRAAAFADQSYTASMEIFKGGELRKTLRFHMIMQGLDKQLITFQAPGEVAGMKILMEDKDTLYVYSPEFKKVRRIAAHMQNQGLFGSTFTYEDMAQAALAPLFDAKLLGKQGDETTLELRPKQGVVSSYPHLEIVIDARQGGVTKIRYFDSAGNVVREQIRDQWTKIAGKPMPMRLTMKNFKTGDSTVISLSDVKVDQAVDRAVFSRRTLMRG